MGEAAVKPIYTLREYYSMERMSNVRHEYWCGGIYAMTGGSPTHSRIIGHILTELTNRLRESSCDAVACTLRIRIESDDFETYPDVVIFCDDAAFEPLDDHTLLEPRLIVEVLSPSTAQYDQTTKLEAYRRVPSLSDYLIVWQDKVCVEHHAREEGSWIKRRYTQRADSVRIESFNIDLSLAEVYRRLDLPEEVGEAH